MDEQSSSSASAASASIPTVKWAPLKRSSNASIDVDFMLITVQSRTLSRWSAMFSTSNLHGELISKTGNTDVDAMCQIASSPVALYITPEKKDAFLQALSVHAPSLYARRHRAPFKAVENSLQLTAEVLSSTLEHAGLPQVVLYAYGFKGSLTTFLPRLTDPSVTCAHDMSTFDFGREFPSSETGFVGSPLVQGNYGIRMEAESSGAASMAEMDSEMTLLEILSRRGGQLRIQQYPSFGTPYGGLRIEGRGIQV